MGSPSILMAFISELEKPRSKNLFKSRNTTTSQAILSKESSGGIIISEY